MLVLTRKVNERISIGDIEIIVSKIRDNTVVLAFDAPKDVHIVRSELKFREQPPTLKGEPHVNTYNPE